MKFCFSHDRRLSKEDDRRGRPDLRSFESDSIDSSMVSRSHESQSTDDVSIGSRISSSPDGPSPKNKPLKRKPLPHYDLGHYALVLENEDGTYATSSRGSKSDPPITRDQLVEVSEIEKRKTILNFPVRDSHYSTANYRLDFISFAFTDKPSVSPDGNVTTYTNVKVQQLIRRTPSAEREPSFGSSNRRSAPCWSHEATITSGVGATVTRDDKGELVMTLKQSKDSTGTLIAGSYPVLAGQRCYVKDGSAFFGDMYKEWQGLDIVRDYDT